MPYEEINVDCKVLLCSQNDSGACDCDCHTDDLNPDHSDCAHFNFSTLFYNVDLKKWEIAGVLSMIEEQEIPFLVIDGESTHFQTVQSAGGDYCLVQGSEADIMDHRIWKHVDGGFGCTHKDQLTLSLFND